jgi:hypothetical protein
VEQAFQACVQHYQKISGLQPPRYVRDSYQATTSVRAASPDGAETTTTNL